VSFFVSGQRLESAASSSARVAVIGTGWWATASHIPALQANKHVSQIVLCDSDPSKLKAAGEAFGLERRYTDLQEMLEREALAGAVIATNHASHYAISKTCLEHDLHIMLEKPMTLHASHARELVSLARDRQRELIVGYPWHYTPEAIEAQAVIASGELGAVQYVMCSAVNSIIGFLRGDFELDTAVHGPGNVYSQPSLSGGGEGHLQITHSAALMFFVTQLRPKRVHALMHNHGLALDLVDVMMLEFEGGALGSLGGTGNGSSGHVDLQVHCERGAVELDMYARRALIVTPEGKQRLLESPNQGEQMYPRAAPVNNLVEVVLGLGANHSSAEVGWRTVEFLEAAYRSAAQDGQAVTIESLYEKEQAHEDQTH
jgi:predicted dehydrogenase